MKIKGFIFSVLLLCTLASCSEMLGNDADVVDGTDKPLLHTPDYRVQEGDTLYSIAFASDLDYRVVAAINHLKPPYHLTRGQRIQLASRTRVALPRPSKAEARRIALLEPNYDRLVHPMPGPKHTPKSTRKLAKETVKKSSKTVTIAKHHIKKRPQVKKIHKKAKVSRTHADNSIRHRKLKRKTRQATTGSRGHTTREKPVNHWHWPTRGKVIATFDSGRVGNKGLDIAGKLGTLVHAAASGVVVYSGSGLRGYGNLIIIKHNARYLSAYAYNQELLVKEGAKVKAGQTIARMGKANSGQVKLHFEIRRAGKPVNPIKYLG